VAAFAAALALPLGACAEPVKFDGARAWADLQRQVGFGPRPSGTPALVKTRQYILD